MKSPVHQIIHLLQTSLSNLGYQPSAEIIEQLGLFVFTAMEGHRRRFHTVKHVLEVCEGMNNLQTLAVLFHDVVYYQIDKGFPTYAAELLLPFIDNSQPNYMLALKADAPTHEAFDLCLAVFGFQRGQQLVAFNGQNEFLSALVAGLLLHKLLKVKDLVAIFACIEATIPFRKADTQHQTCYDKLTVRLQTINNDLGKVWQAEQTTEMVKQAVAVANNDVRNFASADVGVFLDGTWTLLPETYAELAQGGLYTTASYRNALARMEGFFHILKAENIFHQYQNTPQQADFQQLLVRATENLRVSRLYLGTKLLTIAIVEAAALLTGGDAPLSFFLGDVRNPEQVDRAEDFLPPLSQKALQNTDKDETVYKLLEFGRTSPTNFDLQNSPLTSYLYQELGTTLALEFLQQVKLFFDNKISAMDLLQQQNPIIRQVIVAILEACANITDTRKEKLKALATSLK